MQVFTDVTVIRDSKWERESLPRALKDVERGRDSFLVLFSRSFFPRLSLNLVPGIPVCVAQ